MTDEAELALLLQEIRAGKRNALGLLVARVQSRVHRWAARLTGDADVADDVAQDVLVGLEGRIHRFQGKSRFTTWLFSITRNAARQHYRRERRREARRLSELPVHVVAQAELTHDECVIAALIVECYEWLPPRQRQIFELVDLRGREPADVARELGMEQSTVRAHLFKARRTIRGRMLALHEPLLKEFFS